MDTVQFVDAIAASPTVRLDLNDDVTWGLRYDGTDLSPPRLRQAWAGNTLLTDGEQLTAAAFANRRLKLAFDIIGLDVDGVEAQLQLLWRELDRPTNLLRWHMEGAASPVFFRTIRSSENTVNDYPGAGLLRSVDVQITAEPFAYGLKETIAAVTVSADPAAASNGCHWDITGVKGDVETPLILRRPYTSVGSSSLFAVRRRGTPSAAPFVSQAEALTQGSDTTTQPNAAAASGTGNNYSRTTFATTAGWADRVSSTAIPAAASTDARGTYRAFARLRKTGITGVIQVRLSAAGVTPGAVTVPDTSPAVFQMVDLGLTSVPIGADPQYDGWSGVELPARGVPLALQATRTSGTDTLDIDYIMLVPADDRLVIVRWPTDQTAGDRMVLDGVRDMAYPIVNATGEVASSAPGSLAGRPPMVSPGVTNRIYTVNEVGEGAGETGWPASTTITASYWPRYLRAVGA